MEYSDGLTQLPAGGVHTPETTPADVNTYDREDLVRRGTMMLAGGLKFSAYRVRTPDGEFSPQQFHMTYLPTSEAGGVTLIDDAGVVICGMMDEEAFAVFQPFVEHVAMIEDVVHARPITEHHGDFRLDAYATSPEATVQIQIRRGGMVLGVFGLAMAKTFCVLASRASVRGAGHEEAPRKRGSEGRLSGLVG